MLTNVKFMKRLIWLILLTHLALPALAQDDGGDGGDLFNLDSLGSLGTVAPEFDPMVEVRNELARANVSPMDKKQEKDLKKLYDKEVKVAAKPFEKRFDVPLKSAMGAIQSSARGRRGGNARRPESVQAAEARRLAGQLVDAMIAGLRIDQQGPLRRQQSEQARIAKLSSLTSSMASAGTPLTPEQVTQVNAILSRESRLRALMIIEAKGKPYQYQLAQLEAQTNERLVAVLDPPQRITWAETNSSANPSRTTPVAPRRPN
jgi:hypothetical protein